MNLLSKTRSSFLLAGAVFFSACAPPPSESADTVVLIHGLGRSARSMAILSTRLANADFRVVRFGYPSRSEPIEALVDSLEIFLDTCCAGDDSDVHFVTHSMGGLLVRSYLDQEGEPFTGRVVMLSPPNQGSEIVDAFADSPMLRHMLGPSGSRLGTGSTGIPGQLGPIDFELGIITGDRTLNPIGSWLIPGPDDGAVGVDRARIEGAADFKVVSATHTFIMNDQEVARDVVSFIRTGAFRNSSP